MREGDDEKKVEKDHHLPHIREGWREAGWGCVRDGREKEWIRGSTLKC